MTSFKLIFRNVHKNIRDYLIYFLTLTLSVSLFYAFNSISDQPAFSDMGITGSLLYDQLGILLSALSVVIAVVLAFLIIYANQFLLKRRKKELGVYMVLGMKKRRISRLFAGETLCVGVIALVSGLVLGLLFSQGLSLVALKLFAIELDKFQIVFSAGAFRQTVLCFAIIFFIVMLFNVWSVTNVKLIDLLTASRKNESIKAENRVLPLCLFVLSLICIGISAVLFNKNGILPSRENMSFQIAGAALVVGTFLLFNSLSTVFIQVVRAGKGFYLKGLNTFLVRQIGSKIRTNYFVVTIVCGLLTITICAVSIGASTALAMNELSNHDHSRFLTRTNRRVGRTHTMGPQAANEGIDKSIFRQGVVFQMTWPGAPTIYYGDEAGLCGWTDPDNRRTYPWGREDMELIRFHKDMICIHKNYEALIRGSVMFLHGAHKIIAYGRFTDTEQLVVILNTNYEDIDVKLHVRRIGVKNHEIMRRVMLTNEEGYSLETCDYKVEHNMLYMKVPKMSAMVLVNVGRDV